MIKIKEMKYCPWCGSNLQECFQYDIFYEQNTILYCEKCDSFVERYIATHFIEEINKLEKKIENIKNIVMEDEVKKQDCIDCKHHLDPIRWCLKHHKEVFFLGYNNGCGDYEPKNPSGVV